MDKMFEYLYNIYCEMLSDMSIGYPISADKVNKIWCVIHDIYFIQNSYTDSSKINYLLEHYEHL